MTMAANLNRLSFNLSRPSAGLHPPIFDRTRLLSLQHQLSYPPTLGSCDAFHCSRPCLTALATLLVEEEEIAVVTTTATTAIATTTEIVTAMAAIATMTATSVATPPHEALALALTRIDLRRTPTVITSTIPRTQDGSPLAMTRGPPVPKATTLLLRATRNLLHPCRFPATDHNLPRAISHSESTNLQEYKIPTTRIGHLAKTRTGMPIRPVDNHTAQHHPTVAAEDVTVVAVEVVMFASRPLTGPC